MNAELSLLHRREKNRLINRIAEKMEETKLSFRELEKKTGVSKSHLHRVNQLSDQVSIDLLLILADYFDIGYEFRKNERE